MLNSRLKSITVGLALITALSLSLSACSTGMSAFGSNKLAPAEIANIGDYTADTALSEAKAHFRNNDFGYSAALYKRVAELTPNNAEAYVGLGASYDRLGRFDLSDRVYDALYRLSGASAQYYNNVGYSYMLRGNLTAALTNFRKAQKLAPDSVIIANNLQILQNAAAQARA